MLAIVLLLSNLKLLQAKDNPCPSTGELQKVDTATAIIPIYLLRQANIKMIERDYLLQINKEQDSIINLQDKYIKEQNIVIKDFQSKVVKYTDISNKLNKDLEKQIAKTKVITIAGIGVVVGVLTIFLIK